ncbi:MAG: SurA N-terminal domain-containing protein [Flavihumibacter sp.]
MSIIQSIRDKAAWAVFIIIALSLLGFLLMDAFVGKSGRGLFGGNGSTVGSINGEKLEYVKYQTRIRQTEDQYKANGYPMNEMIRQNVQDQVWNQMIEENVLNTQCDQLGLDVTPKELDDILFGANPPADLRQQFSDKDGNYDANAARAAIRNLAKSNPQMAENFSSQYLPALMENRRREKYVSLLSNSYYIPKWMAEKMNTDQNELASISYVSVPYTTVSDSSADIKVSDGDIQAYLNKHQEEFKQEASRSISYVTFNAAPSAGDSAAVKSALETLKPDFAASTDPAAFLLRNNSDQKFADIYVLKSKLQVPNAEAIRELPDGAVFGPYLDGGNYVMAKMVSKRNIPDSVRCRHILVSTQANPDSTAKSRIDSIAAAIKGGADFSTLVLKYSDDQGSKEKGGEYTFGSLQMNSLAPEFAKTIFYGTAGDKKIVKTDFGYHYIEVLSQKNFEPAYQVAYLSRPINASVATDQAASGAANQFAGESRNAKAFEASVTKGNLSKLMATDIKPNDITISGLGASRPLVRWINDARVGDVSEPFAIDDKYVVVMLSEIVKEGTMSVAKARPQLEMIIRNEKKAGVIGKKIGSANTLEAIATATQTTVMTADSVRFTTPFVAGIGQEPKVVGASFDKENQANHQKPSGNTGVFV